MDDSKARDIITEQLDSIAVQRARFDSEAGPTGRDDRDVGDEVDISQRLQGQSEDDALVAALDRERGRLEDALARLDAGNYGTCEICGSAIEDERLETLPWTRRDAQHAPDPDNGG
jgi:DnaK suppressor protein